MSHADDAPNPSQQLLNNAIDTSTIARLRIVLRDMCSESPEAFKLACDKLLVQGKDPKQVPGRTAQRPIHLEDDDDDDDEDEDEDENETDSDEEDYEDYYNAKEPQGGQKRARTHAGQRYEICEQCNEEFDVLGGEECVWHDGELELDYDHPTWYDWDEGPHGPMDRDDTRKQYPEGFMWTCCEERGNDPGCNTTLHEPTSAKRLRA